MKVALASDHAGFEQKELLKPYIESLGYEVIDLGPFNDERVDYPDYAAKLAHMVADNEVDKGVLVCGSGIGMAIAANKIRGIRASVITSPEFAALSRQHNDLNVITLSGRLIPLELNKEILKTWFESSFEEGRHAERLAKIASLEA